MRQKNKRLAAAGSILVVFAVGFFAFMLSYAPGTNDPVGVLRVAGMVSGATGALGLVMIATGLVGKRA